MNKDKDSFKNTVYLLMDDMKSETLCQQWNEFKNYLR